MRLLPLRPFIRRLINFGIEPTEVTQATFEEHMAWVERCSQRKNKAATGPQLRTAWDDCARSVEGWPQVFFELRDGRDIYLLPDSTFPKIIKEFETHVTMPMNSRGKRRGRRRLREVTIRSRRYHFRVTAIANEYISRARPILLREPSDYLFPGFGAGHKSGSMFSQQLADFTEKETGIRVTAHQFRHLGGYIHLLKYPGDYESVRKMLGHRKS